MENLTFGIYVHTQGPGGLLKSMCNEVSLELEARFLVLVLSEIDGLFINFFQTSIFEAGTKVHKRRVKRNYDLKLIGKNTIEHYSCLIAIDIDLPDAVVIAANTEDAMRAYIKKTLLEIAPKLMKGFSDEELERVTQVFETL
jgi:hypothetical protein